ncbi:PAS domain-containing protein [Yoonia sp. BS5-3]|uniref:PAS domain-containing protein n=1 Tax=Yoonia phaeophyticola TaxID=3137369 RepID=A0ABZ2V211_9RHOB
MNTVTEFPQRRRTDAATPQHPTLQNLEQYWRALRHAQRIPSRNDIEPRQIDAALPHAFILQRVAPGVARMRVAGQQLHDLLKMDARGMPISAFFVPEAREQVAELVESAFASKAIVSIQLISCGSLLRQDVTGTMLLLPLRDAEGETTRILGALITDGARGSRPRRFEIAADQPIRHEPQGPQLAAVQAIMPTEKPKGRSAAHGVLRLVVNNS